MPVKRIENLYDVTTRLVGDIIPYGSTHVDEIREENLKQLIELSEKLIADIIYVASYKERQEHSIKQMGNIADDFITNLKETLNVHC